MALKDAYLKLEVFTVYSLMYRAAQARNQTNPLRSKVILSIVLLDEVSFDVNVRLTGTFFIFLFEIYLNSTLRFDEKNCI